MSLRSTTTRRSLRHRLDEWFLSRKVVQRAAENTRKEYDDSLRSVEIMRDLQIETTHRVCDHAGLSRNFGLAMYAKVQREWERQDTDAEFRLIVSQLSHPSQDGAA